MYWEGQERSIPAWVADQMYATLPLQFSVQELAEIFQLCQQLGFSLTELLQDSVLATLHQQSKPLAQAVNARPVKTVVSPSTITRLPLQHIILDSEMAERRFASVIDSTRLFASRAVEPKTQPLRVEEAL